MLLLHTYKKFISNKIYNLYMFSYVWNITLVYYIYIIFTGFIIKVSGIKLTTLVLSQIPLKSLESIIFKFNTWMLQDSLITEWINVSIDKWWG